MPRLAPFTGALRVKGAMKIRPVDLVAVDGALQPGIALVGDAFSTACPVSGTGAAKALLDAERLCNVYVPAWLATPGMGVEKIAQYYNDPEKRRSDAHSFRTSVFAKASRSAKVPAGPRCAGATTRARSHGMSRSTARSPECRRATMRRSARPPRRRESLSLR